MLLLRPYGIDKPSKYHLETNKNKEVCDFYMFLLLGTVLANQK